MAERRSAHRQARLVWWLLVASMVAAGLLVVAAVVSLSAARFGLPAADGLVDACRSLIPRIGVRRAIDLVAVGAGVSVTVRAVSAALVELRGLCRYRQRDPLRMAAAQVTAQAFAFVPGVAALADRHGRSIELAADETVGDNAGARALAGALLLVGATENQDSGLEVWGIAPERVDRLVGRPTSLYRAKTLAAAIGMQFGQEVRRLGGIR